MQARLGFTDGLESIGVNVGRNDSSGEVDIEFKSKSITRNICIGGDLQQQCNKGNLESFLAGTRREPRRLRATARKITDRVADPVIKKGLEVATCVRIARVYLVDLMETLEALIEKAISDTYNDVLARVKQTAEKLHEDLSPAANLSRHHEVCRNVIQVLTSL